MKHLFITLWTVFLIGLMGLTRSYGQGLVEPRLHLFEKLDPAYMPSGKLMDRVPGYINVLDYNGKSREDSIHLKSIQYPMVYSMQALAETDTPVPVEMIHNTETYFRLVDYWQKKDTVETGAMVYSYAALKAYAADSNLITLIDSQYYDVPGRSENPYFKDTMYLFTVFKDKLEGFNHTFHIQEAMFQSNIDGAFDSLEIDFKDGQGFRPVSPGDYVTVTFPDFDTFYIEMRFTMPNGVQRYARSPVEVKMETAGMGLLGDCDDYTPVPTSEGQRGYDTMFHVGQQQFAPDTFIRYYRDSREPGEWLTDTFIIAPTCKYGVEVYGWFNNKCCTGHKVKKPLIIIEGIDPFENHNWDFVMNRTPEQSDEDGESLLDQTYSNDPNEPLLREKLHMEDYDIFFINFCNSLDSIQTNAKWVKQAIDSINALKHSYGSYEKDVVIGASMGGLVGLWALREFELKGEDHETEMYFTFDSPLKGANIPLGIQALMNQIGSFRLFPKKWGGNRLMDIAWGTLGQAFDGINGISARQMMYYYFDPAFIETGYEPKTGVTKSVEEYSVQHDRFYAALNARGHLKIPHIAIANGSIISGVGQKYGPGDKLLSGNVDFYFYDLLQLNTIGFIKSMKSHSFTYVDIYIMANSYVPFTAPLASTYLKAKITGDVKPWDSAPGCVRFLPGNDADKNGKLVQEYVPWDKIGHCFIPTVSSLALDIDDPYFQGYNLLDEEGTISSGLTYVTSYVGSIQSENRLRLADYPDVNMDHVSLDDWHSRYLERQVQEERTLHSPLDDRTYNFGSAITQPAASTDPARTFLKTRRVIDFDLDVYNSGKLWANRVDRIAYTDNTRNPDNSTGEEFDVVIQRHRCDTMPTLVHIYSGGEFKIGDGNAGNISKVYIADSATLKVSHNGTIKLDNSSQIIVQEGGTLEIAEGGFLETDWNTKIKVKKGGKMIIRGDIQGSFLGILQAMHNTEVHIEKGGQLIINGGEIRLWDGNEHDGEANIRITGEMVLNEMFKFSGNGYFQFDKDNILTQKAPFALKGMGRKIRFMRLNPDAKLHINKHGMFLRQGRVDYTGNTEIDLHGQALFAADTCVFSGSGNGNLDRAIMADSAKRVSLDSCIVAGFDTGVRGLHFYSSGGAYHFSCDRTIFVSNGSGVDLSDFNRVKITESQFLGTPDEFEGIGLTDGKIAYIYNGSLITGYGSSEGVYFSNVKYVRFDNSTVSGCETGLYGEDRSNVFIHNGSSVNNNTVGVQMLGGIDYGLVDVSCSYIENNDIGINGVDALLNIDGAVSGHGSNVFRLSDPSQKHFVVSFQVRPVLDVEATQNYWEDDIPFYNGAGNGNYDLQGAAVLYEPDLDDEPTSCVIHGGGCGDGSEPCPCDDIPLTNGLNSLGAQYEEAMGLFLSDQVSSAEAAFAPIVADADGAQTDSLTCIMKYMIGEVFVDSTGGNNAALVTSSKRTTRRVKGTLQAVPNPTTGYVVIHGERGTYQAHLYDHTGQAVRVMDAFKVPGKMEMQTVAKGIYILQLINEETGQSSSVKIVKQ